MKKVDFEEPHREREEVDRQIGSGGGKRERDFGGEGLIRSRRLVWISLSVALFL